MIGGWRDLAACRGRLNLDAFFARSTEAKAKRFCRETCPVIADCLTEAMADPQTVGVWGGTTTEERIRMRRQQHRRGAA